MRVSLHASCVHVRVPACLTGWNARGQQRIALLAAVPFLSVFRVCYTHLA